MGCSQAFVGQVYSDILEARHFDDLLVAPRYGCNRSCSCPLLLGLAFSLDHRDCTFVYVCCYSPLYAVTSHCSLFSGVTISVDLRASQPIQQSCLQISGLCCLRWGFGIRSRAARQRAEPSSTSLPAEPLAFGRGTVLDSGHWAASGAGVRAKKAKA